MKTLSIKQPWAWSIAHGFKPVENRTWRTRYRGDILIHAGQRVDWDGVKWINEHFPEITLPTFAVGINTGGIVGRARLVDCITLAAGLLDKHENRPTAWIHDSPWFFGPYGLVMADSMPLPFFRVQGRLGLYNTDYPLPIDS